MPYRHPRVQAAAFRAAVAMLRMQEEVQCSPHDLLCWLSSGFRSSASDVVLTEVSQKVKSMRNWSEVIESMPEHMRRAFLKWWKEHPPFSFEFDMQALVAEAYQEGYNAAGRCEPIYVKDPCMKLAPGETQGYVAPDPEVA